MITWNYSPSDVTFMDIETQSVLNVRAVGGKQYVRDPSTRLLSAVFKRNGEVITWIPVGRAPRGIESVIENCNVCDEVPEKVQSWIRQGTTFVAHNAESFDAPFWDRHVGLNVPWFDTIHLCRLHGYPASLDAMSKAIGGNGKADDDAMRLLTAAKLNKRTSSIVYPVGTDRLWQKLIEYNIADVEELERIFVHLTSLHIQSSERQMIDLNWRINSHGVNIDLPFARRLRDAWAKSKLEAIDELSEITQGKLNQSNIGSVKQVKAYLASLGLYVESLDKRIVNQILENPDKFIEQADSDDAQLALAVLIQRQNAVRSTIGKIDRLFKVVDSDDTVRNCIVYHGAHTGRFSGRDLQPHNFPRGLQFSSDGVEAKQLLEQAFQADDLLDFSKGVAEKLQEQATSKKDKREATVANILATLTRGVIQAREGHCFAIADYSAVEARGVAWVARCDSMLNTFADVKKDVYCDMASKVFGRTITKKNKDERFIGKTITLGCGYQMSAPKFDATCRVYLVDLASSGVTAEDCVSAYRKGYPEIPAVWRAYNDAALYCLKKRQPINAGRCTFMMDGSFLCLVLPSGRVIRYRNAAIEMLPPKWAPQGPAIEQIRYESGYGFRKSLYGGILAENAVQGLCRDLLRDAIREVSKTYAVVMHVHDEILIEAPKEQAEDALRLLCQIMSNPPKWAENFPIRVEGFTNTHYTKSAVSNSATADFIKGLAV